MFYLIFHVGIARGEYKPNKNDPKIWFSSIESLAQVLSTKNQMLLELIATAKPSSITELAELSGREKSNLSRTLKTMAQYGFVELKPGEGRELIPIAPYGHLKWSVMFLGIVNEVLYNRQRRHSFLGYKSPEQLS